MTKKARFKKLRKHILCVICKENKSFEAVWVKQTQDAFSLDKNHYFIIPEGTYLNDKILIAFYLEGVSTPVSHQYIQREEVERSYIDRQTNIKKTIKLQEIKGLKFDSQLIDMLLNRKLADVFTRVHLDIPSLLLTVLLLIAVVTSIINLGMWFV